MFEWNESFFVDHGVIDEQHMKLVNILNNLYLNINESKGDEVIKKTLQDLIDYTDYHFKVEEEEMTRTKYKHFYKHKSEHNVFIKKIKSFQKEFEEGKVDNSIKILNFLTEWLMKHIRVVDNFLGAYLNEKSINSSK